MNKETEFGKYLKSLRKEAKLTIRQLEEKSGVSNAYLSQLENGKRGLPSPETLNKIHKHLNISYDVLMEKAGHISPKLEMLGELSKEKRQLAEVLIKYLYDKNALTENEKQLLKPICYSILDDLINNFR
jgi:transcriptional regulator with XRE-family HTH domain